MKKNIVLLIFIKVLSVLFQIDIIAQQYQPIPDSNALWLIEEDDGWGGYNYMSYELAPFKDDTIINSKSYVNINNGYYGAFRNDTNGKSYYVPVYSEEEYLLRDFSKDSGDTIRNVAYDLYGINWVLDFIVDSTEFVVSGISTYKIMYLHPVVEDTIPWTNPGEPLIWMEKIGSVGGGILNSLKGSLAARNLYCMHHNDTIYYNLNSITYEQGTCLELVAINDKKTTDLLIHVFHNPVSRQIKFSSLPKNKSMEVVIYNLYYQVVQRKFLLQNEPNQVIELNSKMPNGLYILMIHSNKHVLLTKKIQIK